MNHNDHFPASMPDIHGTKIVVMLPIKNPKNVILDLANSSSLNYARALGHNF